MALENAQHTPSPGASTAKENGLCGSGSGASGKPNEQCFKELKEYLGMDHYEARNWVAFHRYMLLSNISHLFINKLRNLFSVKMHTPGAAPYIEQPVTTDDFLDAAIQLENNSPITSDKIKAVPDRPEQVLTIGLIQIIVNAAFLKIGKIHEENEFQLRSSASAFDSH